jgi:CofD-related protein of GAK system
VQVCRRARIPDPVRIARAKSAPELGPALLFFSGGTALRPLARALKTHTHNSIHLITPFDSGGSSAELRKAFGMLSVGDLRNRLLALADETVLGNPELYALFSHRLPADASDTALRQELRAMVAGTHALVAGVHAPMRRIVQTHLRHFVEHMPEAFDLRGASIGNLALAGGYVNNERDIDSVLFLFSQLVEARGLVLPVVDANLHLAADLENGTQVVGQHRITARGEAAIGARVRELYLVESLDAPRRTTVEVSARVRELIAAADLICFPMGSFYTSVVAPLLPRGVGRAIVAAECPKVYVPSTGLDPERIGCSVAESVAVLLRTIARDCEAEIAAAEAVQLVLVDLANGDYPGGVDVEAIRRLGVEVVDVPLVASASAPRLAPELQRDALLSLG